MRHHEAEHLLHAVEGEEKSHDDAHDRVRTLGVRGENLDLRVVHLFSIESMAWANALPIKAMVLPQPR